MIFKLKPNQVSGITVICDGKKVGAFNEYGYMEVDNPIHAERMKRKGYEEVKLVTCECGHQFDNKGEFLTHVKTCEIHLEAKKNGNSK